MEFKGTPPENATPPPANKASIMAILRASSTLGCPTVIHIHRVGVQRCFLGCGGLDQNFGPKTVSKSNRKKLLEAFFKQTNTHTDRTHTHIKQQKMNKSSVYSQGHCDLYMLAFSSQQKNKPLEWSNQRLSMYGCQSRHTQTKKG